MKLNCNFISRALGRAVEISVVLPSPVFCDVLGVSGEEASYAPKEKISRALPSARRRQR